MPDQRPLLRLTAGNPGPVGLAALTIVLVALAERCPQDDGVEVRTASVAPWRRPERIRGFADPRCWGTVI